MKTQIIALEAHDDFISVRDRMSWAKSPRILLVWPKYEKITLRAADLRILQQHAATLGAEMGVVTRRGDVRRDAERFGIPVFGSAAAAQRQAWGPRKRFLAAEEGRKPRERSELEAMRAAARPAEAGWATQPLGRVGFFMLGVLAVLVIAGLFVPEATITLKPASEAQAITLPVTASEAVSAVSVTGMVPVHSITVTVNGVQSARVNTQSSLPVNKAQGVARFTNLSASDLTIPRGTIVYSVSPATVQFATLNDTHVAGNINAVVEVPIQAVEGGPQGNLPANAIQAIQGGLSLSAAVTNPQPTEGGTERQTAAPSEADRQRLHDVVVELLRAQAVTQMQESIGARDLLLADTLKMGEVRQESYDPPAGQPGNLLKLSMRVDLTASYVKAQDLRQLAEATLNAARPEGYTPLESSLSFHVASAPSVDNSGALHFELQVGRTVVRELPLARANAMVRGMSLPAAADLLQAELPLAGRPVIAMRPSWWPWMPLVPFRITVSSQP